jgi:hypothetical protein
MIFSEIANNTAIGIKKSFDSAINNTSYSDYIKVDNGVVTVTDEGYNLARDINFLDRFYFS